MKTSLLSLATLCGLAAASASWAGYAGAFNVTPQPGGGFDVQSAYAPGASMFWCGAATYAEARMDVSTTQRLYVVAPRQVRPGGSTVRFGLTPPAGSVTQPVTISVDQVGNSMSILQARQYCNDRSIKE